MRWLSEGAEVLTQELARGNPQGAPEAIVVGSGYGGAVAALRFAQAGYKVYVLERGEEMLPGEFPNDMSHLPGHLRVERADRPGVIGRRDGLFDVRLHGKVTTLVGNALGGGSQINANVALRADPDVLRDARWPDKLRAQYDPLDPYYTRVEDMLGVAPYPEENRCQKADELKRLEEPLNRRLRCHHWKGEAQPRASFYRPPLAVSYKAGKNAHGVAQEKCTGCGDCVTGCNVGAKNTLTMNYLPEAKRYGARFFTGVTVVAVRPLEDRGVCQVQFAYSDRDWSNVLGDNEAYGIHWVSQDQPELFVIEAPMVILAAGALGSTEILLRSSYLNKEARFSPRLGTGFSGNGDALHFGFAQDRPVNALGWGNRFPSHANDQPGQRPGPSIVGVLDVRAGLPTRDGVLIEDGIVPGAIAQPTAELITTAALMAQLDSCALKPDGPGEDPLAVNPQALMRTQVYLGVGHDAADSEMRIKAGRVFVDWREAGMQPTLARQKDYLKVAESIAKAVLVANPAAEPLPASLNSVLSGPPPTGTALVVHPLGGCPMGEHFAAGVVNHLGAVFNGASPRSVYRTLLVWDGAIVPCSLGVNPFLTIAALAERAADLVIAPRLGGPAQRRDLAERPPIRPHESPAPQPIAVRLQETMEEVRAGDAQGARKLAKDQQMVLKLRMDVPDLIALLQDPRHRVERLRGYLDVPGLQPRQRLLVGGDSSVELLVSRPGGRLWRMHRGLCAWWRKRGRDELLREVKGLLRGKRAKRNLLGYLRAVLSLANHAGEQRLMNYRLELRDSAGNEYRLEGVKTVDFTRPANQVLDSLTDLDARLLRKPGLALERRGCLRLNLVALAEEDLPQIRAAADMPNALVALAGLPLFFARVLLKIHLWDFRAPDYAPRTDRSPLPKQRPVFVESVRSPMAEGGRLLPQRIWIEVDRGGLSQDEHQIPLALTRFRPPDKAAHATPLLMLPGFAQSTRALACEALDEDLVRHFLGRGFDVWLFDYRTSTALPSCREQCSLDDIARYDIPKAVDRILEVVGGEGWRPPGAPPEAKPQIMAFGHCMGSATLAMSLLSGKLVYHDEVRPPDEPKPPQERPRYEGVAKLGAVVLSQVPLFIEPSDNSRYRRQLAAFLRNAIGLEHVNFAADDGANAREMLMDRLLATLPPALGECEHEHDRVEPRTDIATCKRVSGIIGPLYNHAKVTRSHHLMHHYFGWGSMSIFMQITKFFEYNRLVSADGANHYVTDDNIKAHMKMPVALLHGTNNQVFKFASAVTTKAALKRVHGGEGCELIEATDYAHFDCLIGDQANVDIYPRLSKFLLAQVGARAMPRPPERSA